LSTAALVFLLEKNGRDKSPHHSGFKCAEMRGGGVGTENLKKHINYLKGKSLSGKK